MTNENGIPRLRRIAVYGPSGSGKTTLARELGRRLGLPHIELDELMHYRPNWEDRTPEDFREVIQQTLAANPGGWVTDGNYSTARDLILPHAEVVVWLDLPFHVVYPRLVRRTLRRTITREHLWGTNYETWRQLFTGDSMLVWGIKNWGNHHRKTREALTQAPARTRVVVLKSDRQKQAFLRWAARSDACEQ